MSTNVCEAGLKPADFEGKLLGEGGVEPDGSVGGGGVEPGGGGVESGEDVCK
jgi:hypothetical protein